MHLSFIESLVSHIKIKSLSASSPDRGDFLPGPLSLSGLGDWSLGLEPLSSELWRWGLWRLAGSDTESGFTAEEKRTGAGYENEQQRAPKTTLSENKLLFLF